MKKKLLDFPKKLDVYLKNNKFSPEIRLLATAMMLYPLIEEKILTEQQAATLVGLKSNDLNSIYDHYGLLSDYTPEQYQKEKAILDRFQKEIRAVG